MDILLMEIDLDILEGFYIGEVLWLVLGGGGLFYGGVFSGGFFLSVLLLRFKY
jgi:hypothetical protein